MLTPTGAGQVHDQPVITVRPDEAPQTLGIAESSSITTFRVRAHGRAELREVDGGAKAEGHGEGHGEGGDAQVPT